MVVLIMGLGLGHGLNTSDDRSPARTAIETLLKNKCRSTGWPMHRGGSQLQGLVKDTIGEKPKLAWIYDTGDSIKSSAAIEKGLIYIGSDSGKVHALDLNSGLEIWSFATGGQVEATPCVVSGTVFVGSSDKFFYALDSNTGELKWKYQTEDKILGGANWVLNPEGNGHWILFGSYDGSLYCVDAETGQAIWKHKTEYYINGTPAITQGGEVVFGGCDSYIYILRLSDGTELRKIDSGAYIASSIAVLDGQGYVGHYNNEVLAFDLESAEILWTYSNNSFPYFSSAAVTSDRVVIGSRDKRLHCINRLTGEGLWRLQAQGSIDSSPIVCGNLIIFGSSDGRLYSANLSNGEIVWSYDIGAPVTASPAFADDKIVIGAEDGSVYVFDAG